jgi:hypothetical protein
MIRPLLALDRLFFLRLTSSNRDCLDGGRGERGIFLIIRDLGERESIVF